jgi:hypothetical protein
MWRRPVPQPLGQPLHPGAQVGGLAGSLRQPRSGVSQLHQLARHATPGRDLTPRKGPSATSAVPASPIAWPKCTRATRGSEALPPATAPALISTLIRHPIRPISAGRR